MAVPEVSTEMVTAINTIWVLVAAFLVFFMQPGFAMLEAGLIRVKNVGNILMKNLMDFCMASLGYWAVGFALMYGVGNLFVGGSYFFLAGVPEQISGVPSLAFWLFQLVFAGTAATIVAGAMAERTKFAAYLAYSLVIGAFVYPIVGHWVWGGGWLGNLGFLDFAGSSVVHSVGGWAGLMGAIVLGPRLGKYNEDGSPNAIPGHSVPLAVLGMFILWFGWFGFNSGSTLSGMETGLIAKVAANTNLAAAAGAVVAMAVAWLKTGKPDIGLTINGGLAGLVAITAGCAFVTPLNSIAIGAIGGVIAVYGVSFLDKVRVDDPVGAVPVHAFAGVWGTLAVGLFHETGGLLYGAWWSQLGVQAIGVAAVFAWAAVTVGGVFIIIKYTIGLRVSYEEEIMGLDRGEHAVDSYPDFEVSASRARAAR
jgi:Amt family ammonium transporter